MGIFYQREELMPDSKTVVKSGSEKSISPAVIKRLPGTIGTLEIY